MRYLLLLIYLCCGAVCLSNAQTERNITVGPNVLVSWIGDCQKFREVHIASNPTNTRNLLATGMCQRAYAEPLTKPKVFFSNDGGYSWKESPIPQLIKSDERILDPSVAFDQRGNGYFFAIVSRIVVFRTEDGGRTWSELPPLIYSDHPQVAVDRTSGPYSGTIYLSGLRPQRGDFHQDSKDTHLSLYRSFDNGKIWSRRPVDYATNHADANKGIQTTFPALFTNGNLFVPFYEYPTDLKELENANKNFWFVISADGGNTFSPAQKLLLKDGRDIAGKTTPLFAIDNSTGAFKDRIYAVWLNRDFYVDRNGKSAYFDDKSGTIPSRVMFSFSADMGKTWSEPKAIAPAPLDSDQFKSINIAVNKNAVVAVSWYDTRDTPPGHGALLVNRYIAMSFDGGNAFSTPVRVSSEPTDCSRNRNEVKQIRVAGTFIGFDPPNQCIDGNDYLGLEADADGVFHVAWEDGRTGTPQIWTARVQVNEKKSNVTQLIEADVSDRVWALMQSYREVPSRSAVDVVIRLKNTSTRPIYGPIKVEVVPMTGRNVISGSDSGFSGRILNADNKAQGLGAVFDYSRSIGTSGVLESEAISEGIVWSFSAPKTRAEFPDLKFKVTARIDPTKSEGKAKPTVGTK